MDYPDELGFGHHPDLKPEGGVSLTEATLTERG